MRKIFSLGLLALVLSLSSTVLFAGYEACDDLKDALKEVGIYGWCNAWFDAEEQQDKDHIAGKILAKAAEDGIDDELLMWLVETSCPCFDGLDGLNRLAFAGTFTPSSCGQSTIHALAKYTPSVENLQYGSSPGICSFINNTGDGPATFFLLGLSVEQDGACLAAVNALIREDFTNNSIVCTQ